MSAPRLIVGLGNPGETYRDTRHNIGFMVLDEIAKRMGAAFHEEKRWSGMVAKFTGGYLLKPLTFMNDSGRALAALARFYKVPAASVIAVYDDLTIDLGLVKVSVTGSAGGHNGVASVLEHLGDGFVRYRLGIGPKEPPQMDLKDFVLGKFTPDQQISITSHLPHYLSGLDLLLSRGAETAMNQLNRRDPK